MLQLLAGILGTRFPVGLLVITGWMLLWINPRLGLVTLLGAVGWSFIHEGVLAYGSVDGRARPTPLKYGLLLVLWVGAIYASVRALL